MSSLAASPPFLRSISAVLSELGVSRREFDRWRANGLTPKLVRLPNGQLRIKETDFQAWLSEGLPCPLPSVTVAQAAAEFGLPVGTFSSWVKRGLLPGVPTDFAESARISRAVLDAWVETLPEN